MTETKTNKLPGLLNTLLIIIPVLVLLGWTFDNTLLKRISEGMTAMNPVTAVCFILCGIAFFVYRKEYLSLKGLNSISECMTAMNPKTTENKNQKKNAFFVYRKEYLSLKGLNI